MLFIARSGLYPVEKHAASGQLFDVFYFIRDIQDELFSLQMLI